MELKDKTDNAPIIYGSLRELYGICYENASIDDRTGEIEDKFDGEF
jgi:hypothetical protein